MPSDLNEASLESLIVAQMCAPGGDGPSWVEGQPATFDANYCVDVPALSAFIAATQPELVDALDLDGDSSTKHKFLSRLQGEITKSGIVAVLRDGIGHGPHTVRLYYPTPSAANATAVQQFAANRFTITRQVHYSPTDKGKSLDLVAFVNGLPIATFELKNNITKQTVEDAVQQYKRDRDPRELMFKFGRCMAHFAVDDKNVRFCTELKGAKSWFLPFDQGWNHGAGNPPNPEGLRTDYLWKRILAPASLANIVENYAQIVTEKHPKTQKKTSVSIFPRFHQLDVVRRLLADIEGRGAGHRYLIQHSAGSGKSNSIAWLAHQLTGVEHEGKRAFDSILVVTDRVILDGQIRDTIKNFVQVGSTVVHAESSKDLREAIEAGKKIIITTVQKFPFIVKDIGTDAPRPDVRDHHRRGALEPGRQIVGGDGAGAVRGSASSSEIEDTEDALNRLMEAKKMLPNASLLRFHRDAQEQDPRDVRGAVRRRRRR